MEKGKAFFVVGHKHWGKTETLKSLTRGRQLHWIPIGEFKFFIRRMSNDDIKSSYYEFIEELNPASKPRIVSAFCPTFSAETAETGGDANLILETLRRNYELYFFVIRHRFIPHSTSRNEIDHQEVTAMRAAGTVEVLEDRIEAAERAELLRRFILANV